MIKRLVLVVLVLSLLLGLVALINRLYQATKPADASQHVLWLHVQLDSLERGRHKFIVHDNGRLYAERSTLYQLGLLKPKQGQQADPNQQLPLKSLSPFYNFTLYRQQQRLLISSMAALKTPTTLPAIKQPAPQPVAAKPAAPLQVLIVINDSPKGRHPVHKADQASLALDAVTALKLGLDFPVHHGKAVLPLAILLPGASWRYGPDGELRITAPALLAKALPNPRPRMAKRHIRQAPRQSYQPLSYESWKIAGQTQLFQLPLNSFGFPLITPALATAAGLPATSVGKPLHLFAGEQLVVDLRSRQVQVSQQDTTATKANGQGNKAGGNATKGQANGKSKGKKSDGLPEDSESIIVILSVNHRELGEAFANLDNGGAVYLEQETLRQAGIRADVLSTLKKTELGIKLAGLEPTIRHNFDENEGTLALTIATALLVNQSISLAAKQPKPAEDVTVNSALLNYSMIYRRDLSSGADQLQVPLELAVRAGPALFLSQGTFNRSLTGNQWRRGLSQVVFDNPDSLWRLVIGDTVANSGRTGGSATLGGIGLRSEYSIGNGGNLVAYRRPDVQLSGILETESEVQVFVNDQSVGPPTVLPAGPFTLTDIPAAVGRSNARIVITDALGRKREIDQQFFGSSRGLRPGLHDYNYSLGVQRQGGEDDYDTLTAAGFHRTGITNHLTAGLGFEATEDVQNLQPTISTVLGPLGELDVGVKYSRSDAGEGEAVVAQYNYTSRGEPNFTVSAGAQSFSRDYRSAFASNSRFPKLSYGLSVGFGTAKLGQLTVAYNFTDNRIDGQLRKDLSINYNRRLSNRFNLFISGSRQLGDNSDSNILVGLNYLHDSSNTANLSTEYREQQRPLYRASWQHNSLDTLGTSYRLDTTHQPERDSTALAQVQHTHQLGQVDATLSKTNNAPAQVNLRLSGALTYADGSFHLGRSVTDSFIVVRAEQADLPIASGGQNLGTTDRNGELVYPQARAYARNYLNVNPADVDLGNELIRDAAFVTTQYRSGGVLQLAKGQLNTVEGRLIDSDGKPVQLAVLMYAANGQVTESFTGEDGEFYLEDVSEGALELSASSEKIECIATLTVANSTDLVSMVGDIPCLK